MDPVQLTIIIISFALAILIVVLGIQVFYILREMRTSITKFNSMLDDGKKVTSTIGDSVSGVAGVFSGIKAALSVFKAFKSKEESHERRA